MLAFFTSRPYFGGTLYAEIEAGLSADESKRLPGHLSCYSTEAGKYDLEKCANHLYLIEVGYRLIILVEAVTMILSSLILSIKAFTVKKDNLNTLERYIFDMQAKDPRKRHSGSTKRTRTNH